MKPLSPSRATPPRRCLKDSAAAPGFALIATISVMVLLVMVALAMLSLSTIELRSSTGNTYQATAQANARLALMEAIAELQTNLGPDQRISASSSILDSTPETEEITGLSGLGSARVLGVWNSWDQWLNASSNGTTIRNTYSDGRKERFRKWLVSHTDQTLLENAAAPTTLGFGFTDENAVKLFTPSTLRDDTDLVYAGLIPITNKSGGDPTGHYAWWVGGQNQKANATMAATTPNTGSPAQVELKNGTPYAADFTDLPGFQNMPSDSASINKLMDFNAMGTDASQSPNVPKDELRARFHDLAVSTNGLIADVRWGGLKKDLNLLFERGALPSELTRNGRAQAPSPRGRSADLMAKNPVLPQRGFSSYEMMRDYYRLYKPPTAHALQWDGQAPKTGAYLGHTMNGSLHAALEGYRRLPVILKYYCIYSLRSEKFRKDPVRYNHDLVFTTVVALWNPYNVPLEVADDRFKTYTLPYKILPTQYIGYINGSQLNPDWRDMVQGSSIYDMGRDFAVSIKSNGSGSIRFEPGQVRIFSKKGLNYGTEGANLDLTPGFDPSAAYGQRIRIYSNKPPSNTRWQVALRLTPLWNQDGTAIWWGGNPGAFGNLLRDKAVKDYGDPPATIGTMFDWTSSDFDYVKISPTTSSALATFQPGVEEAIPFAVVGVAMKTSVRTPYDNDPAVAVPDYRSKSWINGLSAVSVQKMNINYNDPNERDLQRLDHNYQLHFSTVNGQNDIGQFFTRDITNTLTTIGTGIGSELANSVPVLELPTVPVTSLPGFAGMRLTPGWYQIPDVGGKGRASARFGDNTSAYTAGVPGVGVGNSFASPMIPGDQIYAYHDFSRLTPQSKAPGSQNPPSGDSNSKAFSDYWDHALLVNDGLWDSWFTSSMVDAQRPTQASARDKDKVIREFYTQGEPLPYPYYTPATGKKTAAEVITTLTGDDGYKHVAAYLANEYSFNVNSTSVTAWRALFSRLEDNKIAYRDRNGGLQTLQAPTGQAAVSRFMTAPAAVETTDIHNGDNVPGIGRMWTGVRFLSSKQLDKLAEECVKQVKLRGPFLNMSDFINRRLSSDKLGLRGAIQAAIDYDDDNPDSSSINYRYKGSEDMISNANHNFADYPFEEAANGSRFTGAPGYVVQSDILRPLSNSLTVRDDTFVIRAYGQAVDTNGNVMARAWCEATVQRTAAYLDPSNAPETPVTTLDSTGNPSPNTALSETNQRFGRKFEITSFRWLNPTEI